MSHSLNTINKGYVIKCCSFFRHCSTYNRLVVVTGEVNEECSDNPDTCTDLNSECVGGTCVCISGTIYNAVNELCGKKTSLYLSLFISISLFFFGVDESVFGIGVHGLLKSNYSYDYTICIRFTKIP